MRRTKKYMGMALLGTALLAFPGCSDTWDEHYNVAEEGSSAATETLWERICNDPELSRFKTIAEKATYYRDEDHPQTGYTFKDMLQSPMQVTVWAPKNSAFTDAEYQQWLNWTETRGYTVQQQLMGNSIALWRRIATGGGQDTIIMLNGKRMLFDKDNFSIQGIYIYADDRNLPATNGTLHTLQESVPFRYNLYEFIKDGVNAADHDISYLHEYVVARDTSYFSEEASIEGVPNADGEPTYVDSVYRKTNQMFRSWGYGGAKSILYNTTYEDNEIFIESFGENIQEEDSVLVMILPTDAAWDEAYQKLEKYYNYSSKYLDKSKQSNGETKIREISEDSLPKFKALNINMDIVTPTCFNVNIQPDANKKKGIWTLDNFIAEKGKSAAYVLNTYGDTLRTDDSWEQTSLFEGTPVEVTNGMGIVADHWNFPAKLYKPDLIIDAEDAYFNLKEAEGEDPTKANSGHETKTVNYNDNSKWWIDSVGRLSNHNFVYLASKTSTGIPAYQFALKGTQQEILESEVMSGKYDIGIVMVPYFYMTSDSVIRYTNDMSAYITKTDTIPYKCRLQATLNLGILDDNNKEMSVACTATAEELNYEGLKVDTIWLFKDYEFPYSYKNLIHTYPTLLITTLRPSGNYSKRNGYTQNFCFDRIILRSKED